MGDADDALKDAPWYVRWMVANVEDAWKWLSIELATLMAILPMLYEYVPSVSEYLTQTERHYLMTGLAVLTILARITRQAPKP